mmetsp:Transcript_2634/g.8136  ORF Transcript_2634/g.8136 Transcript_2634/m.8136 type:complete len:265 (+) Transcript_2634:137-931(+)
MRVARQPRAPQGLKLVASDSDRAFACFTSLLDASSTAFTISRWRSTAVELPSKVMLRWVLKTRSRCSRTTMVYILLWSNGKPRNRKSHWNSSLGSQVSFCSLRCSDDTISLTSHVDTKMLSQLSPCQMVIQEDIAKKSPFSGIWTRMYWKSLTLSAMISKIVCNNAMTKPSGNTGAKRIAPAKMRVTSRYSSNKFGSILFHSCSIISTSSCCSYSLCLGKQGMVSSSTMVPNKPDGFRTKKSDSWLRNAIMSWEKNPRYKNQPM